MAMYRVRNFNNCMCSLKCATHDVENSEFRQSSPIDSLMYPRRLTKSGKKYIAFEDDLFLLFNQERIVGSDALRKFIDSMKPNVKQSIDLTDDQLFKFLKSRHVQSMSELKSWSNYLLANAQQIKADFDAQVSAKLEEIQKQNDPVSSDPVVPPSNPE